MKRFRVTFVGLSDRMLEAKFFRARNAYECGEMVRQWMSPHVVRFFVVEDPD